MKDTIMTTSHQKSRMLKTASLLTLALIALGTAPGASIAQDAAERVPSGPDAPAADISESHASQGKSLAIDEMAPDDAHEEESAGEDGHAEGAAGGGHGTMDLPDLNWSFEGPLGTYDRAQLQRGFQVYRQVCAACHGLERVAYRNLEALGYSEGQIKTIAAEAQVEDGPNDEGEMFMRPGQASDRLASPYPNVQAAKYANNGAAPPDLSLITKARAGGADHTYAILTGYREPPAGEELTATQYWNIYFPGHKIAMPPPLADGMVAYADEAPQTAEQYAKDVSAFLAWAAEPEMERRKQFGAMALLFLAAFAGIMYAAKRKLWHGQVH